METFKIELKPMLEKAVKAMHVDFAKEVRTAEKRTNMWAWIAILAWAVEITGEYFIKSETVEAIGLGAWIVSFFIFVFCLSSLSRKAKKGASMQHFMIDMLTSEHPTIEIGVSVGEKKPEEKTDGKQNSGKVDPAAKTTTKKK